MSRISMEQATDIAAEEPLILGHPSSVASRMSKERIALAQDLLDARARIAELEARHGTVMQEMVDAAVRAFDVYRIPVSTDEDGEIDIAAILEKFMPAALTAALAVAGDGWLPIETAPKDGTPVLALWSVLLPSTTWKTERRMSVVAWIENHPVPHWEPTDAAFLHILRPTHWRPLPPAPEEG